MKDIQKDILLYWSGEADDITIQRVRDCLECDPEARFYLNDLLAINTEFENSKKNIASGVPTCHEMLLEEVLSEVAQVELSIINAEQSKPRWAYLSFASTVAAAFLVLAAAYFLFTHIDKPNQQKSNRQLSLNQGEDKFPHIDRINLSKRLLGPSFSFQKNGNGLVTLRSNRERLQKIRTIKYKQ